MFASLLAATAVIIAVQSLRLASRDQIVIHVMPESISTQRGPSLPPFVKQAGGGPLAYPAARQAEQPLELFPVSRALPISACELEPPLLIQPGLPTVQPTLKQTLQPMLQRALQPVPMDVHRN